MLITDIALAERSESHYDGEVVISTVTVPAGTTVQDGEVLITITDNGTTCQCGRGLYCPQNDIRLFDPTAHTKTVQWLCEHPVQPVHHQWEDGEQAQYDNLPQIGRRVYDQLRTQIGLGHAEAWLISRREFGLRSAA